MKHCVTCKHWLPPGQRSGYGNAVSFAVDQWDDDAGGGVGGYVHGDEADRSFGQCHKINLGTDLGPGDPPLAVTRDASDYVANLYTQADFGCVLWESR